MATPHSNHPHSNHLVKTNPYLARLAKTADIDGQCGLCNLGGGVAREGRLGRYATTCDSCEGVDTELAQAS